MDTSVAKLNVSCPRFEFLEMSEVDVPSIGNNPNEVGDRSHGILCWCMRIDNREPTARGEPETSVTSFGPTASDLIARSGLSTEKSILHAVIFGSENVNPAGAEIRELLFSDPADAARSTQPKIAPSILLDMRDVITQ